MKTHELKIWPEFFEEISNGSKKFEFRRDEGNEYLVGDNLVLKEYKEYNEPTGYTGRSLEVKITSVLYITAVPVECSKMIIDPVHCVIMSIETL